MTAQQPLFQPDTHQPTGDCPACNGTGGELRPPGIPANAGPYPGNIIRCPQCRQERFDYMSHDYAACERRQCGYEWHAQPCKNCRGTGNVEIPYA